MTPAGSGVSGRLKALVRDVPDFPKKGILFKDITPILADAAAFGEGADAIAEPFKSSGVTRVVCVEARGFIFGSVVSRILGAGLVPVRKNGKLPGETVTEEYDLEYGRDAIQVHRDALGPSDRTLIVDDLLATGGTVAATVRLVRRLGAEVVGAAFLIELELLGGRGRLDGCPVHAVLRY